ncbi:Endo-1,4-beta-xylanase A [Psilocybe cubensis]|uniref:Beta-xylanase n=2 Tax=Psilocybe cubensis TaxID=181762 RepID=A0A8H8CLM7_PSICU|nr:Endo-1,4-beta-xylanase A [Psilocybe cubensis]KAH9481222.1 Endo-1,4-beta-xylanase A [Psilocybe cubensis]
MAVKLALSFGCLLSILPLAIAQSGAYGQCGGIGWTGSTTCISGFTCTYSNPYYSQCLPGTAPTSVRTSTAPASTSTAGLAVAAKAAGKKYFGSATDNPELTDAAYVAGLSNLKDFTQITPDATEPSRGTFTFTNGDAVVNLALKNGQLLRGKYHCTGTKISRIYTIYQGTLVYGITNCLTGSQLEGLTTQRFNPSSLLTVAPSSAIIKEKYSWDVVNEPFNEDGTWRDDVFHNTIGDGYVALALRAARAADPAAKLYLNDYNIENTGAKSTAMYNLVKSLQAQGAPIDGVGFQCHFIVGQIPTSFQRVLEQFTALGIEVAITELDIRMTLPATPALLQQQKQDYQNVIAACKNVAGCIGVTIWDYTDKYSWVPSVFPGEGAPLPWDENMVKKPAYDGIIAGFA